MKRHPQTPSCPSCGSVMVYERRDDVIEYRGHQRTIKTLGLWCDNCGEAIFSGKPLVASEKAYLALKAEIDAMERIPVPPLPLRPDEIASVRKKLRLSQKRASELLGVEQRAFKEYESGKVPIGLPLSNLLRLLGNDPKRLNELTGPTVAKVLPAKLNDRARDRLVQTAPKQRPGRNVNIN